MYAQPISVLRNVTMTPYRVNRQNETRCPVRAAMPSAPLLERHHLGHVLGVVAKRAAERGARSADAADAPFAACQAAVETALATGLAERDLAELATPGRAVRHRYGRARDVK
jgi:hypothetical protein